MGVQACIQLRGQERASSSVSERDKDGEHEVAGEHKRPVLIKVPPDLTVWDLDVITFDSGLPVPTDEIKYSVGNESINSARRQTLARKSIKRTLRGMSGWTESDHYSGPRRREETCRKAIDTRRGIGLLVRSEFKSNERVDINPNFRRPTFQVSCLPLPTYLCRRQQLSLRLGRIIDDIVNHPNYHTATAFPTPERPTGSSLVLVANDSVPRRKRRCPAHSRSFSV